MSHRQPRLKDQARALRDSLATKGLELGQGESLELVAKLNGYPSWNVAKQADKKTPAPVAGTTLKFQLWTAVHHHRHGQDHYFFTHLPSEEEVIEHIEAVSSYEPEDDESVEVLGVDVFDIDVPLELAKAAQRAQPPGLVGVYEVCMTDRFEYDTPDEVPAWRWVESVASFNHQGNGVDGGVWEFMVHVAKLADNPGDVPLSLREDVFKAIELGAAWMMFHQG